MPQLQDFQFYQQDRLKEMYEKEAAYELHQHSLAQKEAAARAQGASEDVVKAEVSSFCFRIVVVWLLELTVRLRFNSASTSPPQFRRCDVVCAQH